MASRDTLARRHVEAVTGLMSRPVGNGQSMRLICGLLLQPTCPSRALQRNSNATSNGVELESNVRGHETFSLTIRGPLAPVVDHFSSREDVTLGTRSWEIRCDGPPADRPTQWDLGDSSLFIDICTYSTEKPGNNKITSHLLL
jgi:hypothetical protein